MQEYIDIWTENGIPTGTNCLKDEAHLKGLFHPTVHIWFYTKNGHILLQQRSKHKETFPSFWDVSVAGHILAGESILEAALREIKEEIGLDIIKNNLIQIDIRKNVNVHPNGIKDCEFQHVFLCELLADVNNLKIQEEEVDGITLISLDKLKFYAENRNEAFKLVPADYTYYTFIINQVSKML
ncbi:NUDIX domain-containing protein [Pontimicrobium sp. SW4]|uniref:NUDIX domain-containing protein n=1 Tax=Pontimicrobium sp. SW4 TaxID=3153519 RepID=A0AAU7BP26_9FLAO